MDTLVARQPIFDPRRRVFAYALRFGAGAERHFFPPDFTTPGGGHNPADATWAVPELTDGRPAFIAFPRESLVASLASCLAPNELIVEVSASAATDPEMTAACARMKERGFRIALDEFVGSEATAALLRLADFVSVNAAETTPAERSRLPRELAQAGIAPLARNVDNWEMFADAAAGGYCYFHGCFFSLPVVMSSNAIPGSRLNYLRLVEELSYPTTLVRLERVFKREASLAYRLIRRIDSEAFGVRTEVRSLRHALALLGEHEVRSCAMAWLLAEIGHESPSELVVASTLRARACELIAAQCGGRVDPSQAFLVGLFSMLDAIMERSMEQVVANVPVSEAVREALAGQRNGARLVLDCVRAYERGAWAEAIGLARATGVEEEEALASSYHQALSWADHVLRSPDGSGHQ